MRIVIKMAIELDDGYVAPEKEVLRMDRGADSAIAKAGLGLTMLEAKATLAAVQKEIVAAQAEQIVMQSKACPDCGAVRKEKDSRHVVYRSLYGKLRLRSPRLLTCPCQGKHFRQSFSPLADGLTARSHPELLYLTTRWASIISYGAGRTLLDDVLPIGAALSCSSVRNAVHRIGTHMNNEATVKEDVDAKKIDRATWTRAHRVDGTHQLAVELDAGYIRSNDRSEKGSRWFSATVARLVGTDGAGVCHGFVRQEISFPAARLDRFLGQEGIGDGAAVAVISDGGEDVLGAGYFHYRASQQWLDWFHLAMCFQHLWQALGPVDRATPGGLYTLRTGVESAKWRLWHYQPVSCLSKLSYLSRQLESIPDGEAKTRISKLLLDLQHYLYRNERYLGDYANRHRAGLPISSGTAESTVNCVISKRFVKKQQMRWSPAGANALLQIRCAVLNDRYWRQFELRPPTIEAANDSAMAMAA